MDKNELSSSLLLFRSVCQLGFTPYADGVGTDFRNGRQEV